LLYYIRKAVINAMAIMIMIDVQLCSFFMAAGV